MKKPKTSPAQEVSNNAGPSRANQTQAARGATREATEVADRGGTKRCAAAGSSGDGRHYSTPLQCTLFEEDFLLRTLGDLVRVAAVATEDIDVDSKMATMRSVLLLELKRGGSTIGRTELGQAEGYIEDLLSCGLVDGGSYVHAFVVGRKLDPKTNPVKRVGERPEMGRVEGKTFHQLIRTANVRLFHLRYQVQERYNESGHSLVDKLLQEPTQMSLLGLLHKSSAVASVPVAGGSSGTT